MKKITKFLFLGIVMALPFIFGSCDSDPYYDDYWYDDWTWGDNYNNRPGSNTSREDFFVEMARTLSGQWRGDMWAYEIDAQGYAVDSIFYSTDIEFVQYNSRSISGTGTQYDFNPNNNQLEFQRNFTWYIDPSTGNIYLTYKSRNDDGTVSDYVMRIDYNDLNLNNRRFTGFLWASDGGEVDDFWFDRYTGSRAKSMPVTRAKNTKVLKVVMNPEN